LQVGARHFWWRQLAKGAATVMFLFCFTPQHRAATDQL
jgi:hypothetical protein